MDLLKRQKMLLVLFRVSKHSKKNMKFEDIVVALFKKYPTEFQLKGYSRFPDSDLIRRPLYSFRNEGLLVARNMIFAFTDKGLELAERINNKVGKKKVSTSETFDRYLEKEIKRILQINAYRLFKADKLSEILDTDFFDFLGISVRADKKDVRNRLDILNEMSQAIRFSKTKTHQDLVQLHEFMSQKFKKEIRYYLEAV